MNHARKRLVSFNKYMKKNNETYLAIGTALLPIIKKKERGISNQLNISTIMKHTLP